ncbi:hypothetical protein EWM64_g3121 [Hericium alpestre]|uniref:Uncharacterized protein n=1 Tax=Hericium alpestre TaxID=135208 RepID=A0A4Z0A353_9AGAM|nr:hypothetical protein EWM64_g3121 [Hericium alpestre]
MSLPMLISGADCGPVNPLQGLAKRFDQDRGLQQDYFGVGRAGPSRETFRTEQNARPEFLQEAAQFFENKATTSAPVAGSSSFNLAALRSSLPYSHSPAPALASGQPQMSHTPPPLAAWAADFAVQTPQHTVGASAQASSPVAIRQEQQQGPVQPNFTASMQQQWDDQFKAILPVVSESTPTTEAVAEASRPQDADDLARTAALLINTLRDREMVVEGNTMVPNTQASQSNASGWASDFTSSATVDVKGKGRVINPGVPIVPVEMGSTSALRHKLSSLQRPAEDATASSETAGVNAMDPNEAYFNQENKEYIDYWNHHHAGSVPAATQQDNMKTEWGALQSDWDAFEATASGIRSVQNYQFQQGNPYLTGGRSADVTRRHSLHFAEQQPFSESVLQLEAAVQRDPTDARAWFELGVKQQENERETKAIDALRRALELDPTHLPSWLALAISYTNEGDRVGTQGAVRSWVERNTQYEGAVAAYWASVQKAPADESFEELIGCLIAMARSEAAAGQLDADIQVALAVLLNTNEDYGKAQDCFRAALSVRPEDWQLYNRVGATMANSGRADEAISYYYRALELNPAYIRARFNLGISCINLRRYEEAAHHILDALILQDSDSTSTSDSAIRGVTCSALWDSLRTAALYMQRADLASLCDTQDLDGTCRVLRYSRVSILI